MQDAWFQHPEWWFAPDGAYDTIITASFAHFLDIDSSQHNDDLPAIDRILIYDQLPRHVYRKQYASHVIAYFLQKALQVANSLFARDMDQYSDEQLCFALLPFRHANDFDLITNLVLPRVWNRICKTQTKSRMLQRFIKATYQRMPIIAFPFSYQCSNRSPIPSIPAVIYNNFRDILAFCPNGQPLRPECKFIFDHDFHTDGTVILSLSGGVDSMVASWILKNMQIKIVAVHINYANRQTSDREAAFVMDWCTRYLDIPCHVRRLSEIQRAPCMAHGLRDVYESYTRNVRYQCYKDISSQYAFDPLVVLGHNKDDRLENIFTNIAHRAKYDNLDGMDSINQVDGITFWRPLLDWSKDDIIKFAHAHNIPHLPNSTPEWCQRGQIRNTVVPTLSKWHPEFIPGLHHISKEMQELYSILDNSVDMVISTSPAANTYIVPDAHMHSALFWKRFLNKIHIYASHKSIENLCRAKTNQKVVLNKVTVMLIHKEINDDSFCVCKIFV